MTREGRDGYFPKPIDTSDVKLSDDLLELTELMAKNVHENWSMGRLETGWKYGTERDDEKKLTPCLVPYDELPEAEKDYDRRTAMETLKIIKHLGYEIVRNQ